MATELNSAVTYVCPDRDVECGNRVDRWCAECPKRPSHTADMTRKTEDTARVDYIVANAVRGATYKGITSINVIVHEDDLAMGGPRHAIDCMVRRASQSMLGTGCEQQGEDE